VGGLDAAARRRVAHRLAKLPDAGLEHRIADVRGWPDVFQQLLFGDQLAGMLDQK
jgi:hypothetical protein